MYIDTNVSFVAGPPLWERDLYSGSPNLADQLTNVHVDEVRIFGNVEIADAMNDTLLSGEIGLFGFADAEQLPDLVLG